MKRILLISIILATLLLGACSSSKDSALPHLVLTVSGAGDTLVGMSTKTTQTFHIGKSEWYIETNCDPLEPSGPVALLVSVFPENESIDSNAEVAIVTQTTPGTDTNYVHKKGNFYLSIVAMNIKNWSIKVYE